MIRNKYKVNWFKLLLNLKKYPNADNADQNVHLQERKYDS
jgi:hypothetical protein